MANVQDLKIAQKRIDKDLLEISAKQKAKAPFWYAVAQVFTATAAIAAAVAVYLKGG